MKNLYLFVVVVLSTLCLIVYVENMAIRSSIQFFGSSKSFVIVFFPLFFIIFALWMFVTLYIQNKKKEQELSENSQFDI